MKRTSAGPTGINLEERRNVGLDGLFFRHEAINHTAGAGP